MNKCKLSRIWILLLGAFRVIVESEMSDGAKSLLIEDDPAIVMTLRRVLSEEGHHVLVEKRGDTGLTKAREDGFDVIITDMKLPGLGGLELVRQIHGIKPRLPIILM